MEIPIDFDVHVYKIANEFEWMSDKEVKEHWKNHGKEEGRIYRMPIDFNYEIYRKENEFENMTNEEIKKHWLKYGMNEIRLYKELPKKFNIEYYREKYNLKDLNDKEIKLHWFYHGKKEGRIYNEEKNDEKIGIVYFIWLTKKRNWKVIVEGQLEDLIKSDIMTEGTLNIIITTEDKELLNEGYELIKEYLKEKIEKIKYEIDIYNENTYEYRGIKKLHELGKENSDKIYVYIHSKGMYHYYNNNPNIRWVDEVNLTRETINNWVHIKNIFERVKTIEKIGLLPSIHGFIWFNFFWVRGIYLNLCNDVKITEDRYYYESWLNKEYKGEDKDDMSYSLYSHCIKRYTAYEAIDIISKMR
jgi:hypothetical protein